MPGFLETKKLFISKGISLEMTRPLFHEKSLSADVAAVFNRRAPFAGKASPHGGRSTALPVFAPYPSVPDSPQAGWAVGNRRHVRDATRIGALL